MVVPRPRSRAGILLIVILSLVAVVLCAPEESPKRAPSGFLGVRGKKDSTGFANEDSFNDAMDKRAPAMGFQGVRGKKDQQEPLEQDVGYDKRGPAMGFHGMRGKKDPDTPQEFLQDYMDKRAPSMGFMGMRGKKDPLDDDYFDKRAPVLGFQGMRGKKDEWEDDSDLFKRAPSAGFHGMRGKKEFTGDDEDFMGEKRMGFMGMRGKKESDMEGGDYSELFADEDVWGDQDEVDDVNKRAPAAGFFGMRGKKVPGAGFFGMRGKKGPSAGFFAMRGKKAPAAGFMGMRGKKAPVSGFMGMRGKKESEAALADVDDLDSLLNYLGAAYQHGRDKRNGERAPGSKKAPSGFLGTRGKKNWPTEQVVAPERVNEPETHTSQLSNSE